MTNSLDKIKQESEEKIVDLFHGNFSYDTDAIKFFLNKYLSQAYKAGQKEQKEMERNHPLLESKSFDAGRLAERKEMVAKIRHNLENILYEDSTLTFDKIDSILTLLNDEGK